MSLPGVVYRAGVSTSESSVRYIGHCESPLGPLVMAVSDTAVHRVEFCEADVLAARLDELQHRHQATLHTGSSGLLGRLQQQLQEYFQERRRRFDLPLAAAGSAFQLQVWQQLLQVPYGRTCSYVDVARQLNDPRAARAVGRANRANPIALVIPCHRVINADGEIGGYDGGTWRKRALLEMERGQRQGTLNL